MADLCEIVDGGARTILVVVAHADDPALFIGGTIARWADAGWRVVCVRATDDRWDSVGSTEPATIAANRDELRRAAAILGIAEVIDLGYPTDVLADVSEVELRERIIRLVRTHRPYALVTFDPYAMYGEDNQDHLVVAAATDEAFWTSQFDLHHPEHLADGLEPHGCFERWYFGRRVVDVTDVVDISAVIDRKVDAALAHPTMVRNYLNQLRLQARTGGWEIPPVDEALASGDLRPVMEPLLRRGAEAVGARHGLAMAEEHRVVRFGGLGALLDRWGRRLP
ncbi:MAG TPA: PIG-L family deacetylase [Acidimicrobiales bacterium]|nr:PIG-L family deacetylase [Acidimicrobiales bacterium]